MFKELLPLLPKEMGTAAVTAAGFVALVGLSLWLSGARFNRSLLTLNAVTLGATLGLELPRHIAMPVNGWATAIGGALVLGVTAYIFHRVWTAVGLAIVLVAIAAISTWMLCSNQTDWTWPALGAHPTVAGYLRTLWDQLPAEVRRVLPLSCGTAAITGLAFAMLWPRAGAALLYSLTGTALMVAGSVAVLYCKAPDYLNRLPGTQYTQGAVLVSTVLVGALIQWRLTRASQPSPKSSPERDD